MKIYKETSLEYFKFWSGAKQTAEELTTEEFEQIESELEALYPNGISETELNDIFWFDDDFIAQLLGFDDFDDLVNQHKKQGI